MEPCFSSLHDRRLKDFGLQAEIETQQRQKEKQKKKNLSAVEAEEGPQCSGRRQKATRALWVKKN